MRFQAKVLTTDMVIEMMELQAADADEARRQIEASGVTLLSLVPHTGLRLQPRRSGFNLSVFNQQLHSLLNAGQTVVDAIDILGGDDTAGHQKAINHALLRDLRQGKPLSSAMAALPSVFPALYVAMVQASETTSTVAESIGRYMRYQQQVDEIRSKIKAAAIYPAILLGVGLCVIAFLMLYVVPRFSVVFDDAAARRHSAGGFISAWGGFVRTYPTLAWSGFALVLAALILAFLHPHARNRIYLQALGLPRIGRHMRIFQLARLYRSLSMLLRGGVSILAAMDMTKASLPPAMQDDLRKSAKALSEGKSISMVMAEHGLTTDISARLLRAGESSGNLDHMMEHIADFYDQETSAWIDTTGRLIEPILMVGIGLIIGGVVLMLYAPIFDLANAL